MSLNQTSASNRSGGTPASRALIGVAAASLGVGAALWSGCGSTTEEATNKINSAVDKATEAVNKGVDQAQQELDRVTGNSSTTGSSTTSTSTRTDSTDSSGGY
jgi:hypothetical protein